MHNDFRIANREGWKFTYQGGDLASHVFKTWQKYFALEKAYRQKLSANIDNPAVSTSDKESKSLNEKLVEAGKLKEQCAVFHHECIRLPDREFHLAIGDVLFFGIVVDIAAPVGLEDYRVDPENLNEEILRLERNQVNFDQ